jgi:hypothetical protein
MKDGSNTTLLNALDAIYHMVTSLPAVSIFKLQAHRRTERFDCHCKFQHSCADR